MLYLYIYIRQAFAKLLRRFAVLRRRWRQSRRDKDPKVSRGGGGGGDGGSGRGSSSGSGGRSSGSGNTTAGHSRPVSGVSWPDNSDGQEFLAVNGQAEGGGRPGAGAGAGDEMGTGAGGNEGVGENTTDSNELEMACR